MERVAECQASATGTGSLRRSLIVRFRGSADATDSNALGHCVQMLWQNELDFVLFKLVIRQLGDVSVGFLLLPKNALHHLGY